MNPPYSKEAIAQLAFQAAVMYKATCPVVHRFSHSLLNQHEVLDNVASCLAGKSALDLGGEEGMADGLVFLNQCALIANDYLTFEIDSPAFHFLKDLELCSDTPLSVFPEPPWAVRLLFSGDAILVGGHPLRSATGGFQIPGQAYRLPTAIAGSVGFTHSLPFTGIYQFTVTATDPRSGTTRYCNRRWDGMRLCDALDPSDLNFADVSTEEVAAVDELFSLVLKLGRLFKHQPGRFILPQTVDRKDGKEIRTPGSLIV